MLEAAQAALAAAKAARPASAERDAGVAALAAAKARNAALKEKMSSRSSDDPAVQAALLSA